MAQRDLVHGIPNGILKNEQGLKAYRLFDPTTQKICVSRDVNFKENETWDGKEYISEHINDEPEWTDFKIENLEVTSEYHDQGTQPVKEDNEFPNNDDDRYASPRTGYPLHSQTPHTPSTTKDEPKNYKEASSDQKWIEAMKVELDSINRNNTWELTTLPKGHKAIGLKWVFKTKKDANGNIIKHKSRLVAKGYIQEHGIDFEEVFAPVARMETIRLLLALAANNKWGVHYLDVKSAFLHGDLKEEVYVTQTKGFIKREDNGKVYKLIKALYALKQAPRAWNIKLDNTLKSLDFNKCTLEQAIYTKVSRDSTIIVGGYVDDLIITDTPKKEIDKFKAQMEEKFKMIEMSQDVLTIDSTLRILLLYRGEYSQWVERFMNYLEEQKDGKVMINLIKNGDQPLPRVTQVSIAGTTSTKQPPLKDKSMCNKTAKDLWDALTRHMLGDVNDTMGSKKKTVVVTSDPLALIAEKTNVSKSKEKVVVSLDFEGSEADDFNDKRVEKKADEKKKDMSRVKCYNCKKEGHFATDFKKAKVKDYEYYKTKMLLAKKDKDEQVLLAKDQAWMESSSDSDQEINANMVFMAQIEKVLSDSEASSSSADEKISEVSYYLSESESESEFVTLEYYDNSTNYGLFVNNDDDQ
nr:ribonuclease H-like domain, reverse transcriptase, RNA-dependent DNA polymerase [Tanacetum cinerariifolium]